MPKMGKIEEKHKQLRIRVLQKKQRKPAPIVYGAFCPIETKAVTKKPKGIYWTTRPKPRSILINIDQ
jgi:hypothetical protein